MSQPEGARFGPVTVANTAYGELLAYTMDDPIGLSLQRFGEWAGAELDLMRALVRPGDVVVDVGANVGFHTLALADRVGSGGLIYAVEPQPEMFDLLSANVARNRASKWIRTDQRAASDADGALLALGALDLEHPVNAGASGPRETGTRGEFSVETMTLDSIDLERCDFIKIDVEGMESAVLRGAAKLIQRTRPSMWIECNDVASAAKLLEHLSELDQPVLFVQTAAFRTTNFLGNPDNHFGVATETALLVLRERLLAEALRPREGVMARAFDSLDEVASLLLASPEYGDETGYDRAPDVLRHHLRAAREESAQLREQFQDVSARYQELARSAERSSSRLRVLEAEAQALHSEIQALSIRADRAEARGADYQAAYLSTSSALSRSHAELQAVSSRLEQVSSHLEQEQQRLKQLDAEWREAVHEISKLRATASWRLTGPLRSLGRLRRRR